MNQVNKHASFTIMRRMHHHVQKQGLGSRACRGILRKWRIVQPCKKIADSAVKYDFVAVCLQQTLDSFVMSKHCDPLAKFVRSA